MSPEERAKRVAAVKARRHAKALPKVPMTAEEYRAKRTAAQRECWANSQADFVGPRWPVGIRRTGPKTVSPRSKDEARAAAKALRARQKAEREQAKAQAARAFRKSFVGPPKPKGFRPPARVLSDAERAAKVLQDQSVIAGQDAKTAFLAERRRAEQSRYSSSIVGRPVLSAAKPPPAIDLALIADAAAISLERRRKALEASGAIAQTTSSQIERTKHEPKIACPDNQSPRLYQGGIPRA